MPPRTTSYPSHPASPAAPAGHPPFAPRVGARAAIAVGLADVRRDPDAAAELVTQARLWTPARCLEVAPGWVRVRLPDYEGWVRATEVDAPGRATARVAVVVEDYVVIYADSVRRATAPIEGRWRASDIELPLHTAHVTTILPLAQFRPPVYSERLPVHLPGGRLGWIKPYGVELRSRDQALPPLGPAAVLAVAYSLLNVKYLWGGASLWGIDCSGLSQLCWRAAGATIPRDADQQYAAIPYLVERGDLRPGDLLFFAVRGSINHVGVALGGEHLIHASGSAKRVTINSLDPADPDYSPLLAQMYAGARRPMPDQPNPPATEDQEAR
ncbi:MAG TPA: C40 family peptidase [Ktedonobacterales bacterium]